LNWVELTKIFFSDPSSFNFQICTNYISDEVTLADYPKLLYSEAKVSHKDSTAACCSICLADYKSCNMHSVLPECGHLFHLKCVDPWLRRHPTCPVCRTSPMPTPLSTPLAEVVPLATRPNE
ncbi:putative RING-H2 finger protein atl71, partial [Phtheirospermum japonicum]